MPPHPTFFVRKSVYKKYGLFNLNLGSAADYELMLRFLLKHQINVAYLPMVLVHMRTGGVSNACAIHRSGLMELSEVAVVVGVSSPHRNEAFDACRYIIDQAKIRLPIWKKEYYESGHAEWVNCQRCAHTG